MCEDVQYSSNIVFIFCRRCSDVPARVAAYNLLIELSTTCLDNLKCVANRLISMHHSCRPLNSKDWEVREGGREGWRKKILLRCGRKRREERQEKLA